MSEALWEFACRLYEAPGVRELCLELQDRHGVDVPLLLATCWLWRRGVALDAARRAELGAACRPWQAEVVAPLRAARRALRPEAIPGRALAVPAASRAELKARVQALELEAERRQLDALATLAASWPRAAEPVDLRDHLAAFAPAFGPDSRWRSLETAAAEIPASPP